MSDETGFHGPAILPCELKCDVPAGVTLIGVPTPRHAWSDVLVCPNEDCGRAWLVQHDESASLGVSER